MKYLTLLALLIAGCELKYESSAIRFHYADKVQVVDGFWLNCKGEVRDQAMNNHYQVHFNYDCGYNDATISAEKLRLTKEQNEK